MLGFAGDGLTGSSVALPNGFGRMMMNPGKSLSRESIPRRGWITIFGSPGCWATSMVEKPNARAVRMQVRTSFSRQVPRAQHRLYHFVERTPRLSEAAHRHGGGIGVWLPGAGSGGDGLFRHCRLQRFHVRRAEMGGPDLR